MLYIKVKDKLEKMIKEGKFKEGDKLPSEPALAKQFQVSRSTLREAIKLLQRQDILISKNGDGTYVKKNSNIINSSLNVLQSTVCMIENSGFKVSQSNMEIYESNMLDEWKEKLVCDDDAVVIERIRKSEEKNLAYTFNIIPKSIAKDAFKDGISGSLLKFIDKELNIKINYALSEICIPSGQNIFDEKAISVLGRGTILFKQLHFDEKDRPIFYSYDYMNNDEVNFFIKRTAEF